MILTPGSRTWRAVGTAYIVLSGLSRRHEARFTSGEPMLTVQTRRNSPTDFLPANLVCSPDGKMGLLFDGAGPKRTPVAGGQSETVAGSQVQGMYGLWGEAISPDGKRLIFNADVSLPDSPQTASSKLAVVTLDSVSPSPPLLLQPDPRMARGGGTGFTNPMAFTPDGNTWLHRSRSGRG